MTQTQRTPSRPFAVKARELYDYLEGFEAHNGYMPTFTQIMRDLDISSRATISHRLKRLAAEGCIRRDAKKIRGITLLKKPTKEFVQAKRKPAMRTIIATLRADIRELKRSLAEAEGGAKASDARAEAIYKELQQQHAVNEVCIVTINEAYRATIAGTRFYATAWKHIAKATRAKLKGQTNYPALCPGAEDHLLDAFVAGIQTHLMVAMRECPDPLKLSSALNAIAEYTANELLRAWLKFGEDTVLLSQSESISAGGGKP